MDDTGLTRFKDCGRQDKKRWASTEKLELNKFCKSIIGKYVVGFLYMNVNFM